MNIHNMKLRTKYFECIETGTKRIELRLNDEKRRNITIGDEIIFEEQIDNPRYLKVKVVDLYYEKNFNSLLDKYELKLFSDENTTKEELLVALNQFYILEEQEKYGVVGIKIEII